MYRPGEPFDEIVEMEALYEERRRRRRVFAVIAAVVVIAMLLITLLPAFLRVVRNRPDEAPPTTVGVRALSLGSASEHT